MKSGRKLLVGTLMLNTLLFSANLLLPSMSQSVEIIGSPDVDEDEDEGWWAEEEYQQ